MSASNPTLQLQFARTKRLDPRITFSRASTATYFDATGTMRTAAINEPCFGHEPSTGESLGLSVFEARTNEIENTSTFVNAGAISTGTALAPDGSTAYKFVPTAGAVSFPGRGSVAAQNFANAQTTGQSTDYALTLHFAALGAYKPYIVVDAVDGASGNNLYALALFDPTTGAISGKTLNSGWTESTEAAAVLLPCGMWRVTWVLRFTQQALLRTQIRHTLQCRDAAGSSSYTADGVSGFQYALMQFEQGVNVSPYIPTTTAAATRAAEVVTITGTNFGTNVGPVAVTYAHSANTITVTDAAHGLRVGDRILLEPSTGTTVAIGTKVVSVVDANNYTITHPTNTTTSGNATRKSGFSSSWYNQEAGTVLTKSTVTDNPLAASSVAYLWSNGGAIESCRFPASAGVKDAVVRIGGAAVADFTGSTDTSQTNVTSALSYGKTGFAFCVNSSAPQSIAYTDGVPTINELSIGINGSLNGHISAITYIPAELSVAQIAGLTQ